MVTLTGSMKALDSVQLMAKHSAIQLGLPMVTLMGPTMVTLTVHLTASWTARQMALLWVCHLAMPTDSHSEPLSVNHSANQYI